MTEFRNWLLRYVGLYVGISLALGVLIVFLGRDIGIRAAQIASQRQDLSLRLQAFESLATLRSGEDRAKEFSAALEASLPEKDDLIAFPKALEGFARNNQLGFDPVEFESEEPSAEGLPGSNNFVMRTNGSYTNFIRFLRNIEESTYFVGFSVIDLSQRNGGYEMRMSGKVFSR